MLFEAWVGEKEKKEKNVYEIPRALVYEVFGAATLRALLILLVAILSFYIFVIAVDRTTLSPALAFLLFFYVSTGNNHPTLIYQNTATITP